MAWLLADSIEESYIDEALLRCRDFQYGVEDSIEGEVSAPQCLSGCKFRLIPNNALLDRFNFEEVEARRLTNPFYLPSESQKASVQKKTEELCMTGLTSDSFNFVDRISSSEDSRQSNCRVPCSLIGRPLENREISSNDRKALLQQ